MSTKVDSNSPQLNLFAFPCLGDAEPENGPGLELLRPAVKPGPRARRRPSRQSPDPSAHLVLKGDALDLLPGLTTTASADSSTSGSDPDSLIKELASQKPAGCTRSRRATGTTAARRTTRKAPSLVKISSGEEPMQARAVELYGAYVELSDVAPLEIHRVGPEISVNQVCLNALKARYLARDVGLQEALRGESKVPEVDFGSQRYLADERARKSIERATRDLVAIGALLLNEQGDAVLLRRLPELRQHLANRGVTHVRLCPGGKRRLCDDSGREICLELTQASGPAGNGNEVREG